MIERLYEMYRQELVNWCAAMTGDRNLAEDLVQEAFLRAMLHRELLAELKEEQKKAWLYRTAKNLYIDRVRHNSNESVTETVPECAGNPEEISLTEWRQILEYLPGEEGVLFTMRYLEGYNSQELGKLFGMPPGTVRAKLSSARKHIREALSMSVKGDSYV